MKTLVKTFSVIILVYTIMSVNNFAKAEDASPSAQINQTVQDNLKKRVQKVMGTKVQPEAWYGVAETLMAQSLSLRINGSTQLVDILENTQIINGKTQIDLDDIPVNNNVLVTGQVNQEDIIQADKILVLQDAPEKSTKQTMLAKISVIGLNSSKLTIIDLQSSQAVSLNINSGTKIYDSVPSAKTVRASSLALDDYVLVIFSPASMPEDNPVATSIVVLEDLDAADLEATTSAKLE